ncbi:MAG: hypothetical protein ACQEXB_24245 [Bacillota bacterium]
MLVEEIQDLLDAGNNPSRTATILGLNHKQVIRAIDKHSLEIYTPFDSEVASIEECGIDLSCAEDLLEKACDVAFDDFYVELSNFFSEEYKKIGSYVSNEYGDIIKYLKSKNKSILRDYMFIKCGKCGVDKKLCEYPKREGRSFGLTVGECNDCYSARRKLDYHTKDYYRETIKACGKRWAKNNKDKVAGYVKRAYHVRLARRRGLADDFTSNDLERTLCAFNNSCVLTGHIDTHLDHVIPLSIGHGGTTYGNMIPLRSDLNLSKNNKNIFEWFEANRQRFELSQERFDNLIAWLASANAMSVEEYRDYVYFCHANPRNIDELVDEKGAKECPIKIS